jgi:thiamine biosynthesis protein ThiS
MQVYINGEAQIVSGISTVADLVEKFALNIRKVAVEINLAIVPRSLYGQTALSEGDRIEIVQFIGGG